MPFSSFLSQGEKMKYSDKKKRDDLFRSSLNELLIFAYNTPALSLNERRALVMTDRKSVV